MIESLWYINIKEWEIQEISITEIFKKLFGEDVLAEDYPESGTLAYKIRAREYKITVSGVYADEITQDYMYEDEDEVEVNIRTENYFLIIVILDSRGIESWPPRILFLST